MTHETRSCSSHVSPVLTASRSRKGAIWPKQLTWLALSHWCDSDVTLRPARGLYWAGKGSSAVDTGKNSCSNIYISLTHTQPPTCSHTMTLYHCLLPHSYVDTYSVTHILTVRDCHIHAVSILQPLSLKRTLSNTWLLSGTLTHSLPKQTLWVTDDPYTVALMCRSYRATLGLSAPDRRQGHSDVTRKLNGF
jgi:hypothetical protein